MKIIRRLDFPCVANSPVFLEVTPFELLVSGICTIRDYVYIESFRKLNETAIRVLVGRKGIENPRFDIVAFIPFSLIPNRCPLREYDTGELFYWNIAASRYSIGIVETSALTNDTNVKLRYPPHASTAQELVMKMDLIGHPPPDKVRKIAKLA